MARIAVSVTLGSLLMLAPAGGVASAAELAGVELPGEVKVGETVLGLNGLGLREATFLKVDVYVAALYLETRSSDAETILSSGGPKVLHMHFVRKVGKKDIKKAWVEGFEKNAAADFDALEPSIDTLNGWMQDMAKGESIRFTWTAADRVEVSVKGTPQGTIEGTAFARGLLAVFIGEEPPNEGLKFGLLGG